VAKKTPAEWKEEIDNLKAQADALKVLEGETQKYYELEVKLANAIAERAKATKNYVHGAETYENNIKGATAALEEHTEATTAAEKAGKDFDNALKKSIKTLTGITDASDTLVGSFHKMATGQKNLAGVVDKVKESFDDALSGQKIGISIAQKFTEGTFALAKANDSAAASFNKATGAGGRFNSQIFELEKQNRKFGIGAADSAAAIGDLLQGLSGFGLMARDTQMALADEVAELERLGASGGDVTGVFQTATKAFGLNTAAAKKLTTQAEQLGQELGITTAQAIGDLNSTMPHLANLTGNQVAPAFKRLSEQAIETGMSIDTLTGISDRFMTFETASTAAGNLNAVLGTQMFDTMELLEAQLEGPQAFIDKLRADLQASVGDFDSLNVYQKQSIANASGMSTLELSKLMNAKKLTAEEKKQAESRKKNLKATMDLMAELKALGAELTVAFAPVIKGLKNVLSKIAQLVEGSGKLGDKLGIGSNLGKIGGAGAAAFLATKAKDKISGALGFASGKLGTKKNPMYIQDVNDKNNNNNNNSIKDKLMSKAGKWFGKTKLGKKASGLKGFLGRKMGGALGGGMLGGMARKFGGKGLLKGLARFGGKSALRFVPGVGQAMMAYDALSLAKRGLTGKGMPGAMFHDGTNSTPEGPIIAGDDPGNPRAKPEMIVPPPGSAVINNSTMTKLAKQGGGNNAAVVAAVQALGAKMDQMTAATKENSGDTVLEVDKRVFAKLSNGYFQRGGSFPVRGV